MVVNRYEIIKALGNDFEDLVILDIIPAKMLKWLECYEAYIGQMKTCRSKPEGIRSAAEQFGITQRTLYNIITFMETG